MDLLCSVAQTNPLMELYFPNHDTSVWYMCRRIPQVLIDPWFQMNECVLSDKPYFIVTYKK